MTKCSRSSATLIKHIRREVGTADRYGTCRGSGTRERGASCRTSGTPSAPPSPPPGCSACPQWFSGTPRSGQKKGTCLQIPIPIGKITVVHWIKAELIRIKVYFSPKKPQQVCEPVKKYLGQKMLTYLGTKFFPKLLDFKINFN